MALLRKLSKCQFIVNFIEYFEGINETCIVTEYLGGRDLFNTIARPTFQLNENKCKVITGQILEALTFIHHLKIVHMDIKGIIIIKMEMNNSNPFPQPNNIMFACKRRDNFHVKLIDFGLAREVGGLGRARCGMVGTVEFMSPEVVGGHFAQLESDLWSLGVMLFMMLSGGLSPFWAGNDYKTSARVVAGDFRPGLRPPDLIFYSLSLTELEV